MADLWTYRDYEWGSSTTDIAGYMAHAIDGDIGTIEEATYDVGASYIIVDCGEWIPGTKILLPAGLIERVDLADERVYINRTKQQIGNAPEFDEPRHQGAAYRADLDEHYGEGGPGYQPHDSPLADPVLAGNEKAVSRH